MAARRTRWRAALSATSTHDAKRGEDVRARPERALRSSRRVEGGGDEMARGEPAFRTDVRGVLAPDSNEEYLIYQTLLGAWPFETGDDGRMFTTASSLT